MADFELQAAGISSLYDKIRAEYAIDRKYYRSDNIKRGLRNSDGTAVIVGVTKIGSVQGYVIEDGMRVPIPGRLYYRGYAIEDIIESHRKNDTFGYEEVAYLLLMGSLPNKEQLAGFHALLAQFQTLPNYFFEDMILKAPSPDVMNKLSRSVLALYSYDDDPDDTSLENVLRQCIQLIARFPTIVANSYRVKRHYYDGKSLNIHIPKPDLSLSENFLRLVRSDKSYTDEEAKLLDLMLILHAEHGGGNNSAFVCRTLSSSGTDTYSAIAGAVGSLKGPLHGGANKKVMEMFQDIKDNVKDYSNDAELASYLGRLLDGEAGDHSGKIYGLGHAVYTISDPRAQLLKEFAVNLAEKQGRLEEFHLLESVERLGIPLIMERKNLQEPICANVDLYSGLVYSLLGIPVELLTPLFAIARIAGWCAHRMEEILTCNRLIRPGYRSALRPREYVPVDER